MNLTRHVILLILIFHVKEAVGQSREQATAEADSLIGVLKSKTDPTDQVGTTYTIARLLYRWQPEAALEWCDSTLQLVEKHSIDTVLPKVYAIKGKAFYALSKYEEALKFTRLSASFAGEQGNLDRQVSAMTTEGSILSGLGQSKSAIGVLTKAYQLLENTTDTALMESKVLVIINLGNLLKKGKNYRQAIETFQEGIEISKKMHWVPYLGALYNNLSLVYAEINDFKAQRRMLWEANELLSEKDEGKSAALMSIASTYKNESKPDSAIMFYDKALGLIGRDSLRLISLWNGLSESYALTKNYHSAKAWGEKALALAVHFNNKKEIARAHANIGKSQAGLGFSAAAEHSFDAAMRALPTDEPGIERERLAILEGRLKNRFKGDDLAVYEAFRTAFDTVFNQQKTTAIAVARIEFEAQILEDSLALLNQSNQIQQLDLHSKKQQAWVLWLSLGLLAAVAGGLYFFLAKRRRENEELAQLNRLLKDDNEGLIVKLAGLETARQKPASLVAFAEELVVLNGHEKTIFKIADIIFIQSQGNGLQVTTLEGKQWRWQRLRNLVEVLPTPPFVQTHKSFIINGMHVKTLKAGKFKMSNEEIVPIGAVYQPQVDAFLKEWLPGLS